MLALQLEQLFGSLGTAIAFDADLLLCCCVVSSGDRSCRRCCFELFVLLGLLVVGERVGRGEVLGAQLAKRLLVWLLGSVGLLLIA